MNIHSKILALKKTIIKTRRDIHKHPELSFQEFRTSKIVAERLERYGLIVQKNIGKNVSINGFGKLYPRCLCLLPSPAEGIIF